MFTVSAVCSTSEPYQKCVRLSPSSNQMLATGGVDGFLRLWPLDFSDYLLEAAHDGGVEGVALSRDGLTIGVGCEGVRSGCGGGSASSSSTLR